MEGHGRYYVLAVSQNQVKLFAGTRSGLTEVDLKALPHNLVEALSFHQPEGVFQVRSVHVTGPHSKRIRKESAVFHGQGEVEHKKDDLITYFRKIDHALHAFLRDQQVPLLFAGVDYLYPLYREVNTYPHLCEQHVPGSPAPWNEQDLRMRAHELMEPYWTHARRMDAERLSLHLGSELVTADLEQILPAAHEGRLDALFVAADVQIWGRVLPITRKIELTTSAADREDLLDRAVADALACGTRVYAVPAKELPTGLVAAALLRYATSSPEALQAHGQTVK
jgi:hypothetical protein